MDGNMHSLITALGEAIADGQAACIVTVVSVRGSAPRDAGACMMVTATSTLGTIGGGQLEYQCIRLASERIRTAASGDVCNKIGTYLKALAAFDNTIPFYVALPGPTIDGGEPAGVAMGEHVDRFGLAAPRIESSWLTPGPPKSATMTWICVRPSATMA